MDIQLTLINQSNDSNNSQVVIFQKNVAASFDEVAVAWKVISINGRNDRHSFLVPASNFAAASDSYGNQSDRVQASNGMLLHAVQAPSGVTLKMGAGAGSSKEIQISNQQTQGAIDASIYKDGRLLATKSAIAPQQKAVFQFKPTIWIGVAQSIEEGEIMNSAILSDLNTELSLLGITRADIIMSGGGPGPSPKPFKFTLANVVMA